MVETVLLQHGQSTVLTRLFVQTRPATIGARNVGQIFVQTRSATIGTQDVVQNSVHPSPAILCVVNRMLGSMTKKYLLLMTLVMTMKQIY